MADRTKIEWTDATVNAVNGCTVVSPGCTNCYAMRLAGTRMRDHPTRAGLTVDTKAGPVWNGQVRLNEAALLQPLRWRRPRRIFWNAHGDLFHESVPDEWIDRVFAVCALTPQHQHQILTKRSARMRDYLSTRAGDWMIVWPDANPPGSLPITRHEQRQAMQGKGWPDARLRPSFPLPNVWLGVSAEDQTRADERIPDLLATPAAVRFVSAEPLLGEIRLDAVDAAGWDECFTKPDARGRLNALTGWCYGEERIGTAWEDWCAGGPDEHGMGGPPDWPKPGWAKLDWVIAGGESGPGARPMHPDWARSLRDQCTAAGVPFFFKQWGEWHPCEMEEDGVCRPMPGHGPFNSWSAPMFDADATQGWNWRLTGKAHAGRTLDGRTWDELPAGGGAPHG